MTQFVASVALAALSGSAPADYSEAILETSVVQDAVLDTGLTGQVPGSNDDAVVRGFNATKDRTDDAGLFGKCSRAAVLPITSEN